MRNKILFFIISGFAICVHTNGNTSSLLKPTHFPKTFSDLDFTTQMEIKSEGYDRFSTLTAYEQLELETVNEGINQELDEAIAQNESTVIPLETTNKGINQELNKEIAQNESTVIPNAQDDTTEKHDGYCRQKHPNIPTNQKIPFGSPVLHEHFTYCAPYGLVDRGKGGRPHTGYDIGCTSQSFGRPVFTPADGVVVGVTKNRAGTTNGNYITIDHGNGFRTLYLHLNQMFVTKGQRVSAGCQIGTIGNTGASLETRKKNSSAPPHFNKSLSHLHYMMYYTGNLTSVTTGNKTVDIVHGWPNSTKSSVRRSIDPTQFICVYANFKTGHCGEKFPYKN